MDSTRFDYYQFGGLQTDVSEFLMKDSDLRSCVNMLTHKYGGKQSRFGYVKWLDNPDGHAVRALNFSRYGSLTFMLRASGSKLYTTSFPATTWGSAVYSLASPSTTYPQFVQLSGAGLPVGAPTSTAYTHIVDGATGYLVTTDGLTYQLYPFLSVLAKNPPSFISAWRARIYANTDGTRFGFSSKEFDLYLNPNYSDPGQLNRPWNIPVANANNDPGAWGIPDQQNAGFYGNIVGITNGIDRINIYYQNGIVKWNEQSTIELPYGDNVIPNMLCTDQRNQIDYLVGYGHIYKNDGSTVSEISFGVRKILQDTLKNNGVSSNAFAFCWNNYAFFYFGNMTVDGKTLANSMLVYNTDYNEWYVWSLAHNMSCMGSYFDPSGNNVLVSGDVNGNTYIWDESYTSDAGNPIPYWMRSRYFDFGTPDKSKTTAGVSDKSSVSMKLGQNAKFNLSPDYSGQYYPQVTTDGFLTKYILNIPPKAFKTLSFEIAGSTTTDKAEFYGTTVKFLDQETRPQGKA